MFNIHQSFHCFKCHHQKLSYSNKFRFCVSLFTLFTVSFMAGVAFADNIPDLPVPFKISSKMGKAPIKVILLEFSASWCLDCQLLKPQLKKLQSDAGSSLRIIDLSVDLPTNQPYVKEYHVLTTPTIVLFDSKGKVIQKLENNIRIDEIRKIVSPYLSMNQKK